ncbi:hypothetical protein CC80DRAFT_554002 [Byssothecium circinans]|uniref:Uncharacterized protein n=1 Tax=Byssothecium circinans TaxID=147558 RepID=A0A6A5TGT5_9PLEO|nr:hypothetical protein CC80DRAFT_555876 [Byssothecium circinans]KAF1950852.1 hypothetical protein CC80DRAFT_554002 [Byssothecium circinans]
MRAFALILAAVLPLLVSAAPVEIEARAACPPSCPPEAPHWCKIPPPSFPGVETCVCCF